MFEGRADRIEQILEALFQQTKSGRIKWVTGRRSDQFIYSASGASVLVESRDQDGLPPYLVRIVNSSGEVVSVLNSEDVPSVAELHSLVANRTLLIDETLNGLLRDIESGF